MRLNVSRFIFSLWRMASCSSTVCGHGPLSSWLAPAPLSEVGWAHLRGPVSGWLSCPRLGTPTRACVWLAIVPTVGHTYAGLCLARFRAHGWAHLHGPVSGSLSCPRFCVSFPPSVPHCLDYWNLIASLGIRWTESSHSIPLQHCSSYLSSFGFLYKL